MRKDLKKKVPISYSEFKLQTLLKRRELTMVDVDTFLTILYVMIDDFCQRQDEVAPAHPGPQASLTRSEVVTLSLFGQWVHFPGERAFYRYAQEHLRAA